MIVLQTLPLTASEPPQFVEIPADVLADKIRGGMLGQILGNLNGLPHEMKYIHEPGKVETYTPSLPDGARTDDDTDLEWVYVCEMERTGTILLPPARIAALWKAHINRSLWCANLYARRLMDLGIEPPLTGCTAVNPWAGFNISGQFLCESFGLMAPGMPQTASKIGLHYTRVAIDGEPAQTTQLFCAMIATAFVETDVTTIVDAGLPAVDPACEIRRVVEATRAWCREHPSDWRATRRLIKERYQRHNGEMRDKNGYELNTGSTIAALLYGKGDLVETMRLAFNFGWDADNNAATAAAIVGVVKGRAWMETQGWTVKDVYTNTTRDGMPTDETITGFADKVTAVARRVILQNGGQETAAGGKPGFRIRLETPACVEPLPSPPDRMPSLRTACIPRIEKDLAGSPTDKARAAYLAVCLGENERLRKDQPGTWKEAIEALRGCPELLKQVREAPKPPAALLQERMAAEGLTKPVK